MSFLNLLMTEMSMLATAAAIDRAEKKAKTKRELSEADGDGGKFLTTDGICSYWAPMPAPAPRTKCDSCGSREFKEHHGQSVCTYCRSTG